MQNKKLTNGVIQNLSYQSLIKDEIPFFVYTKKIEINQISLKPFYCLSVLIVVFLQLIVLLLS